MIEFKYRKDVKLFSALHPILIMIAADMWNYAYERHGIKLVITETISTSIRDKMLKRVSKSHLQKRALDIRSKGVDPFILNDILHHINSKQEYRKYHYLSKSGHRRLAYWHVGTAEHIHLSIHSRYALK